MEFFTSSFLPLPLAHMQHPGFAQPSGTWSRSQSSLPCSAEPKHHLPDSKLNKLHFANTVTCLSNITWNAVETKEFPPPYLQLTGDPFQAKAPQTTQLLQRLLEQGLSSRHCHSPWLSQHMLCDQMPCLYTLL